MEAGDSDEGELTESLSSSSESEVEEGEIVENQDQGPQELAADPYVIQFIETKSEKGKSVLNYGGYEYQYDKDSKTLQGIEFWKCIERLADGYCPGRIHVRRQWQLQNLVRFKLGRIINPNHIHQPKPEKVEIRRAIHQLREDAQRDNPIATRDAVDAARSSIQPENRIEAPSASSMSRTYQRKRRSAEEELGDRGLDANPPDMIIPNYLEPNVILNELMNVQNADRKIVAFATPFALNLLLMYPDEIAIDGTFDTAPVGFTQIFTIHCVIDHCAIPIVFACLPSKQMQCYLRVFNAIQQQIPNWQPLRIMSDFEAAEFAAIRQIFPNTIHTGCNFHMGNAIFRKIQTLPGLLTLYNGNVEARHKLRSIQALAFVPQNEIYVFLCILFESLQPTDELFELLKYVAITWIGPSYIRFRPDINPSNPDQNFGANVDGWLKAWIENENLGNRDALFPLEHWNLTERIEEGLSRSNNSIEGWHHIWAGLLRRRPRFSLFVKRMLKEMSRWETIVTDYINAPANGIRGKGVTRKRKYIRQDNNLRQIFAEFEQRANDPCAYLRTISYHLATP